METNRLRQFKTVVDSAGLLKASEVLAISPGGLSKSIRTLESELGYQLFVQKGRGLELTAAGRILYDRIPSALKAIDDLTQLKLGDNSLVNPLRLVSFEVFSTYFLARTVSEQWPSLPLEVRDATPGQMEALVAEGRSELGVTYLPIPHSGVEFVKVGRVRMGVFAHRRLVKGKAVEELPFVVPAIPLSGTPSGVQGLDGWPEHLFERRIKYRVDMMESALQLARQGLAAAFVPVFVIAMANEQASAEFQLLEVDLPAKMRTVHRDIFVIQRRGQEENKIIRSLARALRALD